MVTDTEPDTRLVPKVAPPFRYFPHPIFPYLEFDQFTELPNRTKTKITMRLEVESSPHGNQVGVRICELMEMYYAAAGSVDGLNAKINELETALALKSREVEKLTNQLAESQRQVKQHRDAKGK